jgi:hypothetical protein
VTATDHYILTLARLQYEHTNETTFYLRDTGNGLRKSLQELKNHGYIAAIPNGSANSNMRANLTLKGLAAARSLPDTPTGPLPKAKTNKQKRVETYETLIMNLLLGNPTIPYDAGDVEEQTDGAVPTGAAAPILKELAEAGKLEVAFIDRTTPAYVPTLSTVQGHLRSRYPNEDDYQAAKRAILGIAEPTEPEPADND